MKKKNMTQLLDVSFRYDHAEERLCNIQLTIKEGECVVVTGPSGSGKTTLTRIVNGLIPHFYEGELTGQVLVQGKPADQIQPWEFGSIIGSVFQDSRSQFFASRVEDEIAFSGENYGMPSEMLRERVDQLAKEAGLVHLLKQEVRMLSSGEKQKVAVASACLTNPHLLVMDEPSANLDMTAAGELTVRLASLKQNGKALLIAEHRLYYLLPIADRIIYMNHGEILAEWTPEELLGLSSEQLVRYGLRSPSLGTLPIRIGGDPFKQTEQKQLSLQQVEISPNKWASSLLKEICFSIGKGEMVALTGANGAGKTTLAKAICGLLKQRQGTIALNNQPAKATERNKKAWFVLQDSDHQLFADSVLNEIMLTFEKNKEARTRAEYLMRELDLWSLRERHPASLSGGQKQRVTLAVGLMRRPDVLVLDEPTSGLDGKNMLRVVRLLRQIAGEGVAVLVITHDVEFIFEACARVLFLANKQLKRDLPVRDENRSKIIQMMKSIGLNKLF
ncbi:energy-coupling factor ABC transporter ATP-binding protein [Bacillus horti]